AAARSRNPCGVHTRLRMDPGYRSPLVDLFRRGEASPDVVRLAARGLLPLTAREQIALLVLLSDHSDPEVARLANGTIARLPGDALAEFLTHADVPNEVRAFFAQRAGSDPGDHPSQPRHSAAATRTDSPAGLAQDGAEGDAAEDEEEADGTEPGTSDATETRVLAGLPIAQRLKLAVKGTREQRAQLIRDANKIVATAVLSSPKLTEAEVEAFCKMGNVSEDVLRIIGTNRSWLKNYGVVLGLARNPKTPPALSMQMMHRLTEKDVKMLAIDRNVPEALRLAARRMLVKAKNK
ncbi:MAG TPA: hypothetical protein VFJ02_06960, partial [Vicinamibacterales bacterium]|nr:hypothetical protein [Vicinamibacterales bacterium]